METTLKHETRLVDTYSKTRHGQKVRAIVVHHEAGILTPAQIANVFKNRNSSANYSIDKDGNICLHVPEEFRAWTTGGTNPDDYSITIELSNDKTGGNWHISDNTINTAAALCADICKRYGIASLYYDEKKGTLLRHCDFQATSCPGEYFKSRTSEFCDYVNELMKEGTQTTETPKNTQKKGKSYKVQAGSFSKKENAQKYVETLKKQGIDTIIKEEE